MEQLLRHAAGLRTDIDRAIDRLHIPDLNAQLETLQKASLESDFWSDSTRAQESMKQIARLETRVGPWLELQRLTSDLVDLLKLGDDSLTQDIADQLIDAEKQFDQLKEQLKFAGPFDAHDVILSIHAGAGGTDAQDWALMLLRMYTRWAEASGLTTTMIDESAGEEAGIKSATLETSGAFAYGRLKGEHGVHRLVRLSPFNADHLRQTSFAKVEILPKIDKPDDIALDEKDLRIDVFRSGGHGGQSVNTTDSAVRVTHTPTGIVVVIQNERSQLQNKETALTILRSRLAQLQIEQHAEKLDQIRGPNQSAEWGNQIRSYVLHPYKQVKDLRTRHETSDPDAVLDGKLDPFIDAYAEHSLGTG